MGWGRPDMTQHFETVGMANINGKLHRWSGVAKIAECGAGPLLEATCVELDIYDRGRDEQYGALCSKCWPVLPKDR